MYQVIKRDGKISEFDIAKISNAIQKAFDAVERQYHPSIIDMLALRVTSDFEPKSDMTAFRWRIFRTAWSPS